MSETRSANRFYFNMGLLCLALIIAGFGSAAYIQGKSPLELPTLFHAHAIIYIVWFGLFIFQASLIGKKNYALHKKLGYTSVAVVAAMLITGLAMSAHSFDRGTSPVPDTTIQQFMALPLSDLVGFTLFYVAAVLNRGKALVHKHCMIMACIAIMDPGIARLAIAIGFPPLALLMHIGLVGLVAMHDRKTSGSVHMVTWLGFGWVFVRFLFFMTVAAGATWATMMDSVFG